MNLNSLGETSWEKIFQEWQSSEGNRSEWQQLAQQRGFKSWTEWRQTYLEKFHLLNRSWKLFEIDQSSIPQIYLGPYKSWSKYYQDRKNSTFAQVSDQLTQNDKVQAILNDFPQETQLIGLSDHNKIILFEGHHRCSAIAIAHAQNKNINAKIKIALTFYEDDQDRDLFNKIFEGRLDY